MSISSGEMQEETSKMKILAGTGASKAIDGREAGREAAMAALAALSGQSPALVVTFTTPRYDLAELLAGIRSVTGDAPVIGATSSGEMIQGEYMGFGAGVGVLALTGGSHRFGIASVANVRNDLDKAAQELARASKAQAGPSPHSAIMLLADCLCGDLQRLVQGVYRITGPKTPIVGGAASDEQKFVQTFVLHNDKIVESGAAALWIASEKPLPVVTRHGWKPYGAPMLVTRAEGVEIMEIGGRPAAAVYEEQLDMEPGTLTPGNFWGAALRHPFGLLQPDGSTIIRVPREKTEQGGLRIQGCVPPSGSAVQVMAGNADMLLEIAGEVASTAIAAHPEAGAIIAFSCAARATIFGPRAPEEARLLQAAAGGVPTFGTYCCGEFARTHGVLGTHNATLTAIAL
jgi:hypothetical protein